MESKEKEKDGEVHFQCQHWMPREVDYHSPVYRTVLRSTRCNGLASHKEVHNKKNILKYRASPSRWGLGKPLDVCRLALH